MQCPTCDRRIESKQLDAQQAEWLPFCSARCRQIDMGRWLGEKYSVPTLPSEDDPDELPETDE